MSFHLTRSTRIGINIKISVSTAIAISTHHKHIPAESIDVLNQDQLFLQAGGRCTVSMDTAL